MRSLLCFVLLSFAAPALANYATPGTGVKWNLDSLVANSGASITRVENNVYNINDIVFISFRDTLYINTDATVKFATSSYFDVNGTMLVNPPLSVTFTAQNIANGYLGVRIDSSNTTVLRKLTMEYANSLRLFYCNPLIDSCIFRNNSPNTNFGNAAISLFNANPLITNCQFLNNQRAAITGALNISNAPKIIGCLFEGNNTLNINTPQINLGTTSTGSDTVKIINNRILRAAVMSGGIGFLASGNVYAVISGNIIKNNRYGITFNGGSNIYSLVSYNQIDSNNTQNDPNLGGSGINYTGGPTAGPQNSILTGNLIRWNLWGVTISPGSRAKPNLGNLNNADTTDDGKNQFTGNTNSGTPGIDFYNNTVDSIYAQNNYWDTNDTAIVESRIFHQADNPALGFVNYLPFIKQAPLAVELSAFTARAIKKDVILNWKTLTEDNSDHFKIERSTSGGMFSVIGTVTVKHSTSAIQDYSFTDYNVPAGSSSIYYRLQTVDKDNRAKYSGVVLVKPDGLNAIHLKVYPATVSEYQYLNAEITSEKQRKITIRFVDAQGRIIVNTSKTLVAGDNKFVLTHGNVLPRGSVYVHISGEDFQQTLKIVKQ